MPLTTYPGVFSMELPDMNIPGVAGFLLDVDSGKSGPPITSGMFRLNAGEPLEYTYDFDEFKVVLEGEMHITEKDGTKHVLKQGDMIRFTKGASVTFSTPSTGLTFYVAQR